jgi:hypothetical protein
MRNLMSVGARAVLVPALACSLIGGGAVLALAAFGVRALAADTTAAGPAAGSTAAREARVLQPPAPVVVRTPSSQSGPAVTTAPTAAVWTVPYKGTTGHR